MAFFDPYTSMIGLGMGMGMGGMGGLGMGYGGYGGMMSMMPGMSVSVISDHGYVLWFEGPGLVVTKPGNWRR